MSKVFYADLWGLREEKYRYLWENDVSTTEWQMLEPVSPHFFFVPKDFAFREEYSSFVSLSEAFKFSHVGGKPGDDKLLVSFSQEGIRAKIESFITAYRAGEEERLTEAKRNFVQILDDFAFKESSVEQKLGLDFVREGKGDIGQVQDAAPTTFGPEDILHYAYAVFHSPTYRERYAEFLQIDFPRLPLTSDRELFEALAEKGEELVALHLMESRKLNQLITSFPVAGSNEVVRRHPRYLAPGEPEPETGEPLEAGRVYINSDQYFEGIEPEVWEFQIGGYQVLHKWLKDRKRAGRKLSFDDLFHYQKIVVALKETMRLMGEIDELISAWPIE